MKIGATLNSTLYLSAIFFVLFLVSLHGCSRKGINAKNRVTLKIDTLRIETDSLFASSYNSTSLLVIDSSEIVFFSDPFQKIISAINITDKKFLFNIPLFYDGPDATQNLGWIQVIGKDSIIAVTNDYFYLLNWKGKILDRKSLNINSGNVHFDFSKYKLFTTSNNSVLKKDTALIFAKIQLQTNPAQKEFYKEPLVGSYNYITGEIKDLNIYFPRIYREESSNYDLNTYPRISVDSENIYYTFPFSPSVFEYRKGQSFDFSQKEDSEKIIDPISNLLSGDVVAKATYMETTSRYKSLLFDKTNELIYQIYDLEKENFGDDTQFNIILRDNKFQIIKEVKPSRDLFPTAIVSNEGLIFRQRNSELKNGYIDLIRYNFQVESATIDP